ncbi:MAG: hypothetical protein NTV23_07425 [Propionibacteriales bacterium]|nr:hypothetical protein [Propionibacteriales bacterium]
MDWIRRRPQAAAVAGVVAVIAVLALVFLMVSSSGGEAGTRSIGDLSGQPSSDPTLGLPTVSPSATATPKTAAQLQAETKKQFDQLGQGFTGGNLGSGQLNAPGLQGGSSYQYLPKHQIVLTVTSEAPIGTVGYIVPTSLKQSSGIVKNVKNSWSLTTTAYGDPDYAQLYLQAGSRGFPITCTIRVDGKVVERRSSEGPYARMICQG